MPFDCKATKLVFSIREFAKSSCYRAILYINNVASSLSAIITDGSVNFNAIGTGRIDLKELDLISLYMDFDDGAALPYGICSSLVLE